MALETSPRIAVVLSLLRNATYGLSALNTDLDTILTRIGSPAVSITDYVDEVESLLKNATYGLSALNDDLDTLLGRLSAARAGYLDYLNTDCKLIFSVAYGTPTDGSLIDVLLIDRLTAGRAGYLDNLISIETAGTYTLPSGTLEQDAVVITPTELSNYNKLLLDLNALTQITYIRTYVQVDGANYRLTDYAEFPTDFPTGTKGVIIDLMYASKNMKCTLQSAVAEGANRSVPYFYCRKSEA